MLPSTGADQPRRAAALRSIEMNLLHVDSSILRGRIRPDPRGRFLCELFLTVQLGVGRHAGTPPRGRR